MKKLILTLLIFSCVKFTTEANPPMEIMAYQEKTVHPKDLPENIRKYVTDNYNGAQMVKATVTNSSDTIKEYTIIINYKQEELTLKFDDKGDFVRKV